MARYYDNSSESQRFQPGTTVRADEVDAKFDSVASGFSSIETEVDRSLKLVDDGSNHEVSATATQRRNRVVGFDGNGDLALLRGFTFRGDFAESTEYFVNDVIRDTTTKNLYVIDERHTSGSTRDDSKMSLAIDVDDVEAAKVAAQNAQSAAESAQSSAEDAQGYAQQWANRAEDSLISSAAGGDGVDDFSALHHANKAADSASNAATSESNASASESAAAASESAAATSESNAATSETNAADSASEASTSETNAAASETNAASSASAAATSETNAATSETNASDSASSAATSETNAADSASSASTSETNAAASATAAADSFDSFDDRYLGDKSSAPSTDNDGDPLLVGALYFDTTENKIKIYDGSAWLTAFAPSTDFLQVANNLSDVGSASTSRSNLGLGTVATQDSNSVSLTGGTIAGLSNLEASQASFTGTGAIVLPDGTQAQRPSSPNTGAVRFNTDDGGFEGYDGSAWGPLGGGATGGGSDQVFVENDQTVTADYTVTSNRNAMTAGPIEIDDGVTVTVESGARWVVV